MALARISQLESGGLASPVSDSHETSSSLSSLSLSQKHAPHTPRSLKTPAPSRRASASALPPSLSISTGFNGESTFPLAPVSLPTQARRRGSGVRQSSTSAGSSAAATAVVAGSARRRSSFNQAQQEALQASLAQDPVLQHDPEHTALREALENERLAKHALEEEVSRLRHISMDYKAQLDSLKKSTAGAFGANPASVLSMPGTARRPISMRRGSAVTGGRAAGLVPPTPAAPPGTAVKSNLPPAAAADWNNAWEEDDGESSSAGGTGDMRSQSSEKSSGDQSPMVPSHTNPLAKKSFHSHHLAAGGAAAGAARSALSNPQELAVAVNTFEKNMDEFRTRLRQGVKAHVWEGQKVSNAEVLLRLDSSNRMLIFDSSQAKRGFAFFATRVDIAPIG